MEYNSSSMRYISSVVDLSNPNSSLAIAIKMIGRGKKVLEVGTSTGYVSKVLKERKNYVVGIEIDKEAAEIAKNFCDRMIVADIEKIDLKAELNEKFDVVLLGDVLEHLIDPWTVLKKIKEVLEEDGFVVASIPNIAHGDLMLNLFMGKFNYMERGILDMTHLRFFTFESIKELFESTGYRIKSIKRVKIAIGQTELRPERVDSIPECVLSFIHSLPFSTDYQYVIKAVKHSHNLQTVR